MFTALADPTRRRILELLRSHERSVGEMVFELGCSQTAVSKHLRVLRETGLVDVRVAAQMRYYRIRRARFEELAEWIATFRQPWSTASEEGAGNG